MLDSRPLRVLVIFHNSTQLGCLLDDFGQHTDLRAGDRISQHVNRLILLKPGTDYHDVEV